jgi:DNA-binding transcriptional regulator LsrR (DeoR family)
MRVVEALRFHPTLTQAGISRETGLSRTTVSTVVKELRRRAIVETAMTIPSGVRGGRPGTRLTLTRHITSADPRSAGELSAERIDQVIQQNTVLMSENARLSSLVASIKELMAGRGESPFRG